ncbi:MAG: hypothetical protein IKH11_01855, partial [Bacteroidales bacterium]|nr:hypothetical protein [Bacteroidales bacterium]
LGLLISAFEGLNASWTIVAPEKLQDLKVYPLLRDFSGALLPSLKLFLSQYITPTTATCVL